MPRFVLVYTCFGEGLLTQESDGTRGESGLYIIDDSGFHEISGLHITGRVDPVGAGDSLIAGTSAALATGAPLVKAAELGNLAAGITVQKLFQTGTASPEEILAIQ